MLVQYSAYGFDHFGYPRWLINALLDWKKESSGALVIMFHEIWTFWPIWNKNYLVQQLHRRGLRRLLRVADAVLTNTASQAEHLTSLSPRCAIEVLPVGSNIRPVQPTGEEREAGLAVLFGLQRTRIRTLREMLPELKSLGAAGKIRKIVTAGARWSQKGDDEELALLLQLELTEGFDQRGPLPEEKISELLLACEFAISAQDELSITKSGTFMAAAAHGLNILSVTRTPRSQSLSLSSSRPLSCCRVSPQWNCNRAANGFANGRSELRRGHTSPIKWRESWTYDTDQAASRQSVSGCLRRN